MKALLPNPAIAAIWCKTFARALVLAASLATPTWAALTVNSGNGTVTDSSTSLVWDQCPYGLSGPACTTGTAFYGDWPTALATATQANSASYKGFTDWRVPNKNELESIAKIDTYVSGQPAIDTTAFPGTPLDWFWSSTTYAPLPSDAWIVDFFGYTFADYKTYTYYVRLVRSGQSFASFDSLATPTAPVCNLAASPASITQGGTSTLTASCSPAATSFVWTGGACAGTSSATCTVTPSATTTYTVAGVNAGGTGTAASATVTVVAMLNDTGIDFCGDETTNTASCAAVAKEGGTFPRQDARFGRDAQAAAGTLSKVGGGGKGFDFTKIANNGSVLPADATLGSGATDWACTRDNVTGLIWEVKTTSGLRSQSHTYSWYNSNAATNGGAVGYASLGTCATSGRCDTEKFTADVNAAGLCGASDWRMPRVKELAGIADLGRFDPAIDPDYFPNTPGSHFWSGSPIADYSGSAWGVSFSDGDAGSGSRDGGSAVRLVRGGQ